jgi:hypothetical protein
MLAWMLLFALTFIIAEIIRSENNRLRRKAIPIKIRVESRPSSLSVRNEDRN